MTSTSEFSVLDTQVKHCSVEGMPCVEKSYTTHVDLGFAPEHLQGLVDAYIDSLVEAGIPMAPVRWRGIEDGRLVYKCEFRGQNILELGFGRERSGHLWGFGEHIRAMLSVVAKACAADILFDPHPKNFVFQDGAVSYVDFFPPYGAALIDARLNVASGDERDICEKNFSYFGKAHLPMHFCGDFLNIDARAEALFADIHALAVELGLTTLSVSDYIEHARAIRALEDLRLEKGIFLV